MSSATRSRPVAFLLDMPRVSGEFLVSRGFLHFAILLCRAHGFSPRFIPLQRVPRPRFPTSACQGVERDAIHATSAGILGSSGIRPLWVFDTVLGSEIPSHKIGGSR